MASHDWAGIERVVGPKCSNQVAFGAVDCVGSTDMREGCWGLTIAYRKEEH
jgi:hypothetical protein